MYANTNFSSHGYLLTLTAQRHGATLSVGPFTSAKREMLTVVLPLFWQYSMRLPLMLILESCRGKTPTNFCRRADVNSLFIVGPHLEGNKTRYYTRFHVHKYSTRPAISILHWHILQFQLSLEFVRIVIS